VARLVAFSDQLSLDFLAFWSGERLSSLIRETL